MEGIDFVPYNASSQPKSQMELTSASPSVFREQVREIGVAGLTAALTHLERSA
jgi:hypothetical protein